MRLTHKLLFFITIVLLVTGCDPGNNSRADETSFVTCEGCHSSETYLKAFYTSNEKTLTGKTSYSENWEKVYINLTEDQKSYKDVDPVHGLIGCNNCHGGQEPGSYDAAHDTTFGFVRDPSIMSEQNCNPCHEQIVSTNTNSMHTKAWGQRTAIAQRELGADKNHQNFDECPVELTDGYDKECSSCHTTCGQCHISRPNVADGGLTNNHKFMKPPNQEETCMICHARTIGTDLKGSNSGNVPDVHYVGGKQCIDCHQENFHADASQYEDRYHIPDLPECIDCHTTQSESSQTNLYHTMHWPDVGSGLACQVCHSQPYNNCNNCHTNGEWQQGLNEYTEYPEFRIGLNIDEELHMGKWAVVRHAPVSPDSYEPWGHSELANYDARPTWEYSSPHNIVRAAPQTNVGGDGDCSSKCHVSGTNADTNKDLFLWQSFVDENYPIESIANDSVAIDGTNLPSGWVGY